MTRLGVVRSFSGNAFTSAGVCVLLLALFIPAASTTVFGQGMDLRQAAGVPLPAADLPPGTISVRLVRGSFANNLSGETVVFSVDGREQAVVTDETGRAQVSNLPAGARVRAVATVGGERLESQEVSVGTTGIRFVLVASDEAGPSAPVAATRGNVFVGPESRIVFDFSNELLNVYYVLHVINPSQGPVDLDGPLVIDLPAEARGAVRMDGSTLQATVSGARVTVLGPFAPGRTDVNVAFTLPFNGDTATLEQSWPVAVQPFAVFALKTGDMDLASTQLTGKQSSVRDGQTVIMSLTPQFSAGDTLAVDVTGLPHRSTWPRNVALGMAGALCAIGLWAAFGPGVRRRRE